MLIIIITWLLTIATAQAQNGLSVSPLFEGKVIPTQRMVETRVKGKMLSKYQLNFFRSVRFKANNKQEINSVHDMVEQDMKKYPGYMYADNYSSGKSHSRETLMLQLPKQGNQNRFLCYKRNNDEVTVIYMEGTLNSLDTLRELIK